MTDAHPPLTADGRHIVVDGRRWRATDPTIPAGLRKQLIDELMAARRAVRAAGEDRVALAEARARVHDAKIALGERGRPWWEDPDPEAMVQRTAATIRTMVRKRGADKTVCPSEIARVVASPDWRPWMDQVRSVGRDLAAAGTIAVTQAGRPVTDLDTVTGPIRYRLAR